MSIYTTVLMRTIGPNEICYNRLFVKVRKSRSSQNIINIINIHKNVCT